MRSCNRLCVVVWTLLLILGLAAAPTLAATTIDLQANGGGTVYAGTPVEITATVTIEGATVTNPEIEWSLADDSLGTLSAVYGEAVYTPGLPVPVGKWDCVSTVVYASCGGAVGELPLTVYPAAAKDDALARAKVYLRAQQAEDGSLTDDWAAIALATAGEDLTADDWLKGGRGHLDVLRTAVAGWDGSPSTTDVSRVVLAVASAARSDAAVDPYNFGGRDLVALLKSRQDPVTGHFGLPGEAKWINAHVWAVLALSSTGAEVPRADLARDWLIDAQNEDGGWGWTTDRSDPWGGYLSDSNDTAAAIRALVELGGAGKEPDSPLANALAYLKTMQERDGGFVYDRQWESASDASSDALVIQALAAVGEDPQATVWDSDAGKDAVDHLLGLQKADGSFCWQSGNDGWSKVNNTALALTGLACLDPANLPENPPAASQDPGDGSNPADGEGITVTVEVSGLDGATMYEALEVDLENGEQTPLGALEALGADVETAYGGGYVVGIDGLNEKEYGPTSGWTYLVNGTSPGAAANACSLDDGDDVLWRYVRSLTETGDPVVMAVQEIPEDLDAGLNRVIDALAGLCSPQTSLAQGLPITVEARNQLGQDLENNQVRLSAGISPGEVSLVTDALLEAGILADLDGLAGVTNITVTEMTGDPVEQLHPLGRTPASSAFAFGPEHTVLSKPALIFIRCLPPGNTPASALTLAGWNPERQSWETLPAAYDPGTGLLGARVNHFSIYRVFVPLPSAAAPNAPQWASDAVSGLADRGVFASSPDKAVLDGPVTRAEYAGWVARALGFVPTDRPGAFPDLPEGHPWTAEIARATDTGLVAGHGDGTFRPEQSLTRQEMAVLLVRVRECLGSECTACPTGSGLTGFVDAGQVSTWARATVAEAVDAGLIAGHPDGRLAPLDPCSGTEAAVMLWRLITRIQ